MPKVSVIIPFYNHVEWLCEAVDCVLAQTYKDYEIIVVNDGSKENVDEFLEKYGDKINYYFKENGGAATARNMYLNFFMRHQYTGTTISGPLNPGSIETPPSDS